VCVCVYFIYMYTCVYIYIKHYKLIASARIYIYKYITVYKKSSRSECIFMLFIYYQSFQA